MDLAVRANTIGHAMGAGLVDKLGASFYDYKIIDSRHMILVRLCAWLKDNSARGQAFHLQSGRWLVIEANHTDAQIENTHHLACKLFLEHEHAELMRDGKGGPSPYYPRH